MTISGKLLSGGCILLAALVAGSVAADANQKEQLVEKRSHARGEVQCMATSRQDNASGADATSKVRRARGLPPVHANAKLAEAAARHACDMARRGVMSHRGSSTTGPAQRVRAVGYRPGITAENIAAGPFSHAAVHAAWEASNGHLSNILLPQIREYGVGRAIGADGKTEYWAAVYSAPRGRRR